MAQPRPRDEFETEGEYLKAYWIMSEFGVDVDDYDHFESFFNGAFNSKCPQTLGEKKHWDELPEVVTIYRGYNANNPMRWDGYSWTSEKDLAKFFARRRPEEGLGSVVCAEVEKDRICAVILERGGEVEYIVTDVGDEDLTEVIQEKEE